MQRIVKLLFILTIMLAYQELTIRWAAAPPIDPDPPGTPVGNTLMHLSTIAGVIGYGVYRFWKK